MVWLATKTLEAIDTAVAADGGIAYRRNLGLVMPHIGDAYSEKEDGYRTHLGASVIGGECERAVAYGWRWALKRPPRGKKGEHPTKAHSRMVRLWNRGHMEEGRFIALMLTIGAQIYQQDADGKQFRISMLGGHYSGSGDGVGVGIPDLPPGVPALTEYKTHSNKSFESLVEKGLKVAKKVHYVQMQTYMGNMGLQYGLYVAVNKDNDVLYAEIIRYDGVTDAEYLERARRIVFGTEMPKRMHGASPGYFHCKYMCDFPDVCFSTVKPDRNCRTCEFGFAMPDGTWQCENPVTRIEADSAGWEDPIRLDKAAQIAGCERYQLDGALK